jgi:hypothetical protein
MNYMKVLKKFLQTLNLVLCSEYLDKYSCVPSKYLIIVVLHSSLVVHRAVEQLEFP